MGYPTFMEELEILERTSRNHPIEGIKAVMTRDELIQVQQEVKEVYIDKSIQEYIVHLVTKTREDVATYLGVSPRGSIALMKAAKAYAYIYGRDYVLPDDVKFLVPFVFGHRIILSSEARYEGMTSEEVISQIVKSAQIPIRKEF